MIENDPDILQALDESDLEWVNLWKLALDETKKTIPNMLGEK
jgi:hypothetical protein